MRARARRRNSCPCLGSSADRADDEVVRTQLERGGAPPEVGRLRGRAALGGRASRTREVGCRIDPFQEEVERRWFDLGLALSRPVEMWTTRAGLKLGHLFLI